MSWAELTRRSINHTGQAIGFSFDYLWNYTNALNETDPRSQSLFHPHGNLTRLCLTYDACVAEVGADNVLYSRRDVYDRVLLWRVPLIALVATTTLPALGYHTQLFTILHLIASPIDTLWSLFYKLDLARRHAVWAAKDSQKSRFSFEPNTLTVDNDHAPQGREQNGREGSSSARETFDLDVIALIVNAYQEWHLGEEAKTTIFYHFQESLPLENRTRIRSCYELAAAYIAADRVARILPSFVATLAFFTQLFAGFWKTLDNLDVRPRGDLNRTPHNIAFGALYFWLPFAVLTTAIVGGAQTENSVPRILNHLRDDTNKVYSEWRGPLEERETTFPKLEFFMAKRRIAGGLPTWQPDKFQDWSNGHSKFFLASLALSVLIVSIPTIAAIWVSWRTPTEGFGCRSLTQTGFFVFWFISYIIDWLLTMVIRESSAGPGAVRGQQIYWITFAKDLCLTTGAITMLTYTSIGIFNNCNCWTKWFPDHSGSQRYLSFPQEQLVFDTIKRRLQYEFRTVTTVALGIELFIFFLVWVYFLRGRRVLKQRDMELVSRQQLGIVRLWFKSFWTNIKGLFAPMEEEREESEDDQDTLLVAIPSRRSQNSSLQRRQNSGTLESQI